MNYSTYFRLLIIGPIVLVLVGYLMDLSYPFPESINGYYGQLALDGFSDWFYIQLLLILLAFIADLLMYFYVKNSRELWILSTSGVLITGMMMPEINISSSLNQEMLQLAAIISGVKIASAYLSPQIRDLFWMNAKGRRLTSPKPSYPNNFFLVVKLIFLGLRCSGISLSMPM